VSQWIKVEKDLANDPRVLRMASRLRNADVTLASRSKLVVIGALVTLWWYADTHIGDDDVLPIGADQIDELVGLTGFCEIMPADWLQIIDANSVKLVGYFAHNGSIAKARALTSRRQEAYRNNTKKSSRSSNAPVTPDALPDKIREDKIRPDKSKNVLSAAPTTRAADVTRETNLDWFLDFKLAYPNRAGDQGWRAAQRAAHARLAEGHTSSEIIEGARRYAAYVEAIGKAGTEFVKRASSFLGPEDPPHFLQPWTPPATKAEARQERNLSASEQWLAESEARDAIN
jgi:hypothetical protein